MKDMRNHSTERGVRKADRVRSVLSLLCSVVLMLGVARLALAQSDVSPAPEDPSPHSDARLLSEYDGIQPGQPFVVALHLSMDEGWHSYWKNSGDSGQETYIEWDLPEGFSAGEIMWPFPERIDLGPLTSYGYSDEVFLLTEVTPPDSLRPGEAVSLNGTADWLICAEVCYPARGEITLELPVRAEAPVPTAWQPAFAETRTMLPAALPDWDIRATRSGGTYALYLMPPAGRDVPMEDAYFFPTEKAVLDHAAPQPVTRGKGAYLIALQKSAYAAAPAERLAGILVAPEGQTWDAAGRVPALAIDVAVEDAQSAGLVLDDGPAALSLLWALVLAFAGGLLLNLMPCVFPILSIKILGFARQSGDAAPGVRRHGLVFGAGVLVSFWVLAGLLLVLRAGGNQIGWGFQLQSPLFIAVMALLFFGIGLSLMGVFEVGMGLMRWGGRLEQAAATPSLGGSFLSGVLATIVATPCTAPFMGAALGVALTLSPGEALLIFTALGAGMALPYVGLSMAPRLLKRLPRPGAWMETLKQVLAFPMFATTVWLAWVFGQQAGIDGVALLLFALLLLGSAGWILGRWGTAGVSARVRVLTRSLAGLALAGAVTLCLLGTGFEGATVRPASYDGQAEWQAFSTTSVEQLRAEGRPVFIDFTAAWCLTCQVNKRTTLGTKAVQQAFEEKQVTLFRADWTNQDPEISQALDALGRSGVPVYVLYKGDGSAPLLLPEILTEDLVLDALDKLPPRPAVASVTPSPDPS